MNLKNSHIIVTGGNSGIGKEIAKDLVNLGAKVLITGRNKSKIEAVAKEINAIPYVFDISDLESIKQHAKACSDLLGNKIDVLINNAGIGEFPSLGEITINHLESVYKTNVFGLALFTQELLPIFKSQKSGNIINLGSTASLKGFARGSVYAASKFAVRGMTQSWQAELRPFNIRVSLINPSEVTTAFANPERIERDDESNKLSAKEVSDSILSVLQIKDRGFIPEITLWATNPF